MRVLLHTPLKPPDHPIPSGDREMARGLRRLLRRLGHRVLMPMASLVACAGGACVQVESVDPLRRSEREGRRRDRT